MRPLLLDLFCGAGGAAVGYHRAGFDVIGVDIAPQPRYPFPFVQANALEHLASLTWLEVQQYAAVHASPPCPRYSTIGKQARQQGRAVLERHPDLVGPTRDALRAAGLPYVIENVPGAPLHAPSLLCGSMVGLDVRRHRLFETSFQLLAPPCQHGVWTNSYTQARYHGGKRETVSRTIGVYGGGQGMGAGEGDLWRAAMGIEWMTRRELAQAIPPAFTELVGWQLLAALPVTAARTSA